MTKRQVSQTVFDANTARIKSEYAGTPDLRDHILLVLGQTFEPYGKGVAAPAEAPVAQAGAPTDKASRIRNIIELTGVDRTEAERRMRVADGIGNPDDMTRAELDVHIRTFNPSVMGVEDEGTTSGPFGFRDVIAETADGERFGLPEPAGIQWPPTPTTEANPLRVAGYTDADVVRKD